MSFLCLKDNTLEDQPDVLGAAFPFGQFQMPEHAEICCPKAQDCYSSVHLAYFSWGLKFHNLMGSEAKAAINSYTPDCFFLFCK